MPLVERPRLLQAMWKHQQEVGSLWLLKTADAERVLFHHESLDVVGQEKMWYENRGYSVIIEKDVKNKAGQSQLPILGLVVVVVMLLLSFFVSESYHIISYHII